MKGRLMSYWLGLISLVVLGGGAMIAQEAAPSKVKARPPAPDEEVVIDWDSADDEWPEVEWFEEGSATPATPRPHRAERGKMVIRGESGPWLGVVLSDIGPEKAKELKLPGERGVLVKEVREESPAAKAGVLKDDVILEFDGEKIRSAAQLRRLVRETPTERNVTIVVSRAGQTKTLTAKLERRHYGPMAFPSPPLPHGEFKFRLPFPPDFEMPEFDVMIYRGARLGISGDDLTPQLAKFFGVKQGKGVLVREVIVGGAAEKAGLMAGDVIVAVDGKEVATVAKLRRALAGKKTNTEKRQVTLTIVRDKREQTLNVELDTEDKARPRPVVRVELDMDPEAVQECAEEMAAQAKEIAEQAQGLALEHQQLPEALQQLEEELQEMETEINREMKPLWVEPEKI